MGKKTKVGKTRRDKFYKLAKEAGYRSRAAFKLIQLNKKYNFLGSSRVLIDLCAAPGGWLQVAAKYMPVSSVIIGVDRVTIKPIHNVICLTEDITTDKCRASIRKETKGWKVDCVLHDGAPNVGTSWTQDAYTQSALVLMALKIACEHLGNGGWFITKVFRSSDYNALMWVFQQLFAKVHATKPQASRNESAEIFVVCQGYTKPDKIDPRLFDPKAVFSEVELPSNPVDILHQKPGKKAKAVGYPDGDATFHKNLSASTFILSDEPIALLTSASRIVFDDSPGPDPATGKPLPSIYLAHRETTDEIKACCQDIRVLGKTEIKALLKWRLLMKEFTEEVEKLQKRQAKARGESADEDGEEHGDNDDNDDNDDDDDDDDDVEGDSADEDAALDLEMDALEREALAERKRLRRKVYKKRVKMRERLNLKMDIPGDTVEIAKDESLFALSEIKSADSLAKIAEAALSIMDRNPELLAASNEDHEVMLGKSKRAALEGDFGGQDDDDDDDDDDDAGGDGRSRTAAMERYLDKMYENYKAKKGSKVPRVKKGKKVKAAAVEDEDEGDIDYADEETRREREVAKLYQARIVPDVSSSVAEMPDVVHADDVGDDSDDSDDEDDEDDDENGDSDDDDDDDDDDDNDDNGGFERYIPPKSTGQGGADGDKRKSGGAQGQKNPLLLNLEEENLSKARKTKLWFSDSLFKKAEVGDDDDDDLEIKRLKLLAKQSALQKKRKHDDGDDDDDEDAEYAGRSYSYNEGTQDDFSDDDDDDDDDDNGDESEDEGAGRKASEASKAKKGTAAASGDKAKAKGKGKTKQDNRRGKKLRAINEVDKDGFEIVPAVAARSAEDDDDEEEEDDDEGGNDEDRKARLARLRKASLGPEGLALGTLMLSKSKKRDLIDASYHRYAFNDKNLPTWFVEDEAQHTVPSLPITKEMVKEYRQRMRELNARPIKKEIEAKGRKRMRLERSLERAKQKAQAISEAPDLTEAQKAKQIQKLMKQSTKGSEKKDKIKYIVSRRNASKPKGVKGKYKLVDARLKKDKRAAKAKARKEKSRR